jgi:hypothetical protein
MRLEAYKCSKHGQTANILGIGLTRGGRIRNGNGTTCDGSRLTIGFWWFCILLWFSHKENS